jgi:DNA polymerase elongation subunit (family B)
MINSWMHYLIEKKFGEDEFLYSDTDSIYATLSVEELKSLGMELHHTKLGAWDIEKEFTKFKCLGAKKYILYGKEYESKYEYEIHKHCAGLPYEAQQTLNFDNFFLGAKFHKKQKKKVIGGYRLEMMEFTLKDFTFY